MSKASKVTQVQLTVSEEFAEVLKRLLFALNWDEFPEASSVVDDLSHIDIGEADLLYNEATGEFERT